MPLGPVKRSGMQTCAAVWIALAIVSAFALGGCAHPRYLAVPVPPPSPPPPPPPPANRNPAVNISCDPCTVTPGGTSELVASANDPDGDAVTYEWLPTAGSISVSRSSRSVIWTAPSLPGMVTVAVVVRDGRGGSANHEVHLVVERPPIALQPPPWDSSSGSWHFQMTSGFHSGGHTRDTVTSPVVSPPRRATDRTPPPDVAVTVPDIVASPENAGTHAQPPPVGPPGHTGSTEASPPGGSNVFRMVLLGSGVLLLVVVVGAAVAVPHPTDFQFFVFRSTLAAGCASIAAATPWFASSGEGKVQLASAAAGAAGVFWLVYATDPARRFGPSRDRTEAAANRKTDAVVAPPVGGVAVPRRVFISYRRTDAMAVGRLHSVLIEKFGEQSVFKDIASITPGLDFRKELASALQSCRVAVVVIGPDWEHAKNDAGLRRLDDPADFVVLEIKTLLARDIPIIPIFLERPLSLSPSAVPPDLSPLVFRQALPLRPDPDFDRDAEDLIAAIETLFERDAGRAFATGAPSAG